MTHARYLNDFDSTVTVVVFWSFVGITAFAVLFLARREKGLANSRQSPMYDNTYLHEKKGYQSSNFHKNITEITKDLEVYAKSDWMEGWQQRQGDLESNARLARDREVAEIGHSAESQSLREQVAAFEEIKKKRDIVRTNVVQLMTTAAEERETIDLVLQRQIDTMLFEVAKQDDAVSEAMGMQSEAMQQSEAVAVDGTSLQQGGLTPTQSASGEVLGRTSSSSLLRGTSQQSDYDAGADDLLEWALLDASGQEVKVDALQRHLGDFHKTVLIRLRNTSSTKLRLQSGTQLASGAWVEEAKLRMVSQAVVGQGEVDHQVVTCTPPSYLLPRTEVVIAATSKSVFGFGSEGVKGELVFMAEPDGPDAFKANFGWRFKLSFESKLQSSGRCSMTPIAPMPGRDSESAATMVAGGLWSTSAAVRKQSQANLRLTESFCDKVPGSTGFWECERELVDAGDHYEALFKFIHTEGEAAVTQTHKSNIVRSHVNFWIMVRSR